MARPLVQAWSPSKDEQEAFRANDETFQWLCELPVHVRRQYAGKWIAARGREVIAAADSLDALLAQLGGSDRQSVIIDRIERPAWMVYR